MAPRQKRKPVTLPAAIAYFTYARLLRDMLHSDASFVVCIIMEDERLFEHHEIAIHTLMERRRLVTPNRPTDRYKVHAVFGGRGNASKVLDDALTCRQVFYLLGPKGELPDELRAAADLVHVFYVPETDAVRAAVWLLCGHRPSIEDSVFVGGAPWQAAAACFRRGRTFDEALRRLQAFASPTLGTTVEVSTEDDDVVEEAPEIQSLEDLVGYGEAKEWGLQLKEDLEDLRHGRIGWEELDTGVLLIGPPGTGKTMFASILAKACGVSFFSASYSEWQQAGHMGEQLAAMRKTFSDAQKNAPSIILVDEMDSFGRRGGGFTDRDYKNTVLNAFLECLDGARRRRGVIVVGTTNFPDEIDRALLRPGRISGKIYIDLPDADARLKILSRYLGGPLW
jgi:cell division protease FtsH